MKSFRALWFFAEQKQRNQKQSKHAAVNIRQNVGAAASDCRLGACKMIREKIKRVEIFFVFGGRAAWGCGAVGENRYKGYNHKSRKQYGDYWVKGKFNSRTPKKRIWKPFCKRCFFAQGSVKFLLDWVICKIVGEKIQNGKNAYHICHIVVCKEHQGERNAVKSWLALVNYFSIPSKITGKRTMASSHIRFQ